MFLTWFGVIAIVAVVLIGLFVMITRGRSKGAVASMLVVVALFAIIIILFALRVS